MTNNFLNNPTTPSPGMPVAQPAEKQRDGLPMVDRGEKPTKAPLAARDANPPSGRSGMEQAMGALADKVHAPKRR